jgi:hypothetical protein
MSAFAPWQIEPIRKIAQPEAWEIYERLGYKRPTLLD